MQASNRSTPTATRQATNSAVVATSSFLRRKRCCGIVLLTALALFGGPAGAADLASPSPPVAHPITGKWTWMLPGTKCRETLQYRADGTRSGSSGEEVTEATFQITPKPSLLGFYRLNESLTQANGKRDCAGDLHEAGADSPARFVQLSPKMDLLIVCQAESLKACYGPLRRSTD